MEKINTYLDDLIENYRKEIGYKLGDKKNGDAVCIALIILEKICERSVNIVCRRNLQDEPSVLYNLREEEFKELVGRAFIGVALHFKSDESDFSISYSDIPYLETRIKLIVDKFPHYKSLKENNIEIENKLRMMYRVVGSEILRRLEEMEMIKITKTGNYENPLVHVEILDKAYEFIKKHEKCRIASLENKYKMIVYD